MRVLPDRTVEGLLSTHDQLLGGASGHKIPRAACSRPTLLLGSKISEPAMVIGGRHLAEGGVLGRFAVDFVVGPRTPTGEWTAYARVSS